MFKKHIQKKLEQYVRKYFLSHPEVKLVAVVGSVGKTTTKTAIATVLSEKLRVRMHDSNHNTHMSVPLAMLGIEYPTNIRSFWQWQRVFKAAKRRIKQPSDVDVIVQELGTDRMGEIAHFGTYLRPAVTVVTAVQPEHMEFFGSIENVAQEELAAVNFSEVGIINRDDIDGRFANFITNAAIDTYGTTTAAEYRFETDDVNPIDGYDGKIFAPELVEPLTAHVHVLGEHILRAAMAAVAVSLKLGLNSSEIVNGLAKVRSVKGRMNILKGQESSTLIDDTYNSSPSAALAALQVLYSINAPQRIAVLGDMNELGNTSASEHETLGKFCDPNLLAWVVTVGEQAEKFLAPAARARGCQVKSFKTAIEAGGFTRGILVQDAIVLLKGSQGGIYLEEATKMLLHETHEDHELVRQSAEWRAIKNNHFSKFNS